MKIISTLYNLMWGDLITIRLPGGSSVGLSLLVMILVPAGIFFYDKDKIYFITKISAYSSDCKRKEV